jgi:hypothetical protein
MNRPEFNKADVSDGLCYQELSLREVDNQQFKGEFTVGIELE